MGKIILLIYVIGAVISILVRQKKKKRLQQQIREQQEGDGAQDEIKIEPDTPPAIQQEYVNPLIRHFKNVGQRKQLNSPEQDPQKSDKPQPVRGRNILVDVAREFGLVHKEEDGKNPEYQEPEETSSLGQNFDTTLNESPEETDEEWDVSSTAEPAAAKPEMIMGLAERKPQVSPSLAVSLNSSKNQILSDLKNPTSFKRAFILKTILDHPVSLKNPLTR